MTDQKVRTVFGLLHDIYTDEGIAVWLHSPNANLDDRRPVELLAEEDGDDEVYHEARRIAGRL